MDPRLQQALVNYRPGPDVEELVRQTDIMFLVGPTGAGKDSLKEELLKDPKYHHIVSHTTRRPRINHGVLEQDGREYHFINIATAEQMLKDRAFVEAKVYSGNLYGTSAAEIKTAHDGHKIAITDLEVQGVAEYKALSATIMAVFLVPPDFTEWQARLQRRYGDVVDAEDMRLRLQTGLDEIEQLLTTDYYFAVVNDRLENAVREVQTIADSHQHDAVQEQKAREMAQQLAADIQAHLAGTLDSKSQELGFL